MSEARTRGVNVYVYNIDSKDIEPNVSRFFDQQGIRYDVAFTHAKLFAVDECMVAIGSYSWLAKENIWENATLRLSGRECTDLVPLLGGVSGNHPKVPYSCFLFKMKEFSRLR